MTKSDIFYLILVILYLAAVAWYVRGVLVARKQREESKHTGHRRKSSSSSSSSSGSSRRGRGRRCPQCRKVIDQRRTLCQHCGQELEAIPGLEPHPDEIKSGRRQPLPTEEEA